MAWNLMQRSKPKSNVLDEFQNRFNSLFDDFWKNDEDHLVSVQFAPKMDITEDDKQIIVKADLPGLEQKDIDIQIHNGILTVKGERRVENEKKDNKHHIHEVCYGSFQRSIQLPEGVKENSIQANYKNGVLILNIPKDEAKAPKQIKVQVA